LNKFILQKLKFTSHLKESSQL